MNNIMEFIKNNETQFRKEFKETYKQALINIGIKVDKATEFVESDNLRLKDIGICSAVVLKVDEYVRNKYPYYDASLSYETFNKLYSYNKKFMYESAKEESN